MITALGIENFKKFKEFTKIELRNCTLLTGPNNSGKSTVIDALELLSYSLSDDLRELKFVRENTNSNMANFFNKASDSKQMKFSFDLDDLSFVYGILTLELTYKLDEKKGNGRLITYEIYSNRKKLFGISNFKELPTNHEYADPDYNFDYFLNVELIYKLLFKFYKKLESLSKNLSQFKQNIQAIYQQHYLNKNIILKNSIFTDGISDYDYIPQEIIAKQWNEDYSSENDKANELLDLDRYFIEGLLNQEEDYIIKLLYGIMVTNDNVSNYSRITSDLEFAENRNKEIQLSLISNQEYHDAYLTAKMSVYGFGLKKVKKNFVGNLLLEINKVNGYIESNKIIKENRTISEFDFRVNYDGNWLNCAFSTKGDEQNPILMELDKKIKNIRSFLNSRLRYNLRPLNFVDLTHIKSKRKYDYNDKDLFFLTLNDLSEWQFSIQQNFNKNRIKFKSISNQNSETLATQLMELGICDSMLVERNDELSIVSYYLIIEGNKINIADVGTGVVKLIYLLATLKSNFGTLVVQEPESNLHPKLQTELAKIFTTISSYQKIIVETHSEYMIRGLQYQVAMKKIDSKSIIMYYFNPPSVYPTFDFYKNKLKNKKSSQFDFVTEFKTQKDNLYSKAFDNEDEFLKEVERLKKSEDISFKIEINSLGILSRPFGKGFLDEADSLAIGLFNLQNAMKN